MRLGVSLKGGEGLHLCCSPEAVCSHNPGGHDRKVCSATFIGELIPSRLPRESDGAGWAQLPSLSRQSILHCCSLAWVPPRLSTKNVPPFLRQGMRKANNTAIQARVSTL